MRIDKEKLERALQMFNENDSFESIFIQTGVSRFILNKRLKAKGIPTRRSGRHSNPDTQERLRLAVGLYALGTPIKEIYEKTGMCGAFLYRALGETKNRIRGPKKARRIRSVPDEEILKRYQSGETMQSIATFVGCTRARIQQKLAEYGLDAGGGGRSVATNKQKQTIQDAYRPGMLLKDVAEATGASTYATQTALEDVYVPNPATAPLRDIEALKALYENNTAVAIAEKFDVNLNTVIRYLKKAGIPVRSYRAMGKILKDTRLYDKDWLVEQLKIRSYQDIADEFNVSITTVCHIRKRLGIGPKLTRAHQNTKNG